MPEDEIYQFVESPVFTEEGELTLPPRRYLVARRKLEGVSVRLGERVVKLSSTEWLLLRTAGRVRKIEQ